MKIKRLSEVIFVIIADDGKYLGHCSWTGYNGMIWMHDADGEYIGASEFNWFHIDIAKIRGNIRHFMEKYLEEKANEN